MLSKLSFKYQHLERVLCLLETLIPGLVKADIFFYDELNEVLRAKTKNASIDIPEGIDWEFDNIKSEVAKFRSNKPGYYWFHTVDLPWHSSGYENVNTNLFSDYTVLMCAMANEKTSPKNDLIFFHFKNGLSNLKMNIGNTAITESERDFVGIMCLNALKTIYATANNDIAFWSMFSERFKTMGLEIEMQRKEIEKLHIKNQERNIDAVKYFLRELSGQRSREYALSQRASEKVKNYQGKHYNLQLIIQNAVKLAEMTHDGVENQTLIIDEHYINFDVTNNAEAHETGLDKVFDYLNIIENAALLLKEKHKPVIGDNLAAATKPTRSKASITMYIQNHFEDIKKLFILYPEKWHISRTEFKPIVKVQLKIDNAGYVRQAKQ